MGWEAAHKPADVLPSNLRLGSGPGVGSAIKGAARFFDLGIGARVTERLRNNRVGEVGRRCAGPRTLSNVTNRVQKSHNEDSLVEVGQPWAGVGKVGGTLTKPGGAGGLGEHPSPTGQFFKGTSL